jgi:hypothetical protein
MYLDPIYKCVIYLTKACISSKITEKQVFDTVRSVAPFHSALNEIITPAFEKPVNGVIVIDGTLADSPSLQLLARVFEALVKVDKRRTFHKPNFRACFLLILVGLVKLYLF